MRVPLEPNRLFISGNRQACFHVQSVVKSACKIVDVLAPVLELRTRLGPSLRSFSLSPSV